ncbi:FHA domain-containing protein [Adlercreutzia aquisgranensis]|uniref:FHA domain-containing protein n=1 Tax=Adlercreutzia aquisgranensis TaxID=2941323 RepID=UPI003D80D804
MTQREARPVFLRFPSGRSVELGLGVEERIGRGCSNRSIAEELGCFSTVSRRHCSLFVGSDGRTVTVRDEGSMNGTRVGEDSAPLREGELRTAVLPVRIRLGQSVELYIE